MPLFKNCYPLQCFLRGLAFSFPFLPQPTKILTGLTGKKKVRKSDAELYKEWTEKYGEDGARTIAETVKKCEDDYEYLKKFAIKV
jgi:hypothetical protein